jgi:peptide/nickel transport system permease protein
MLAYIVRRFLYAIPILVGVNLITFGLFFVVNTPEDMARMQLGAKSVTPDAIEKWKAERGYDRPLLWNGAKAGVSRLTETIFFQKSAQLFAFDFGNADDGRSIGHEIRTRMWPSLALRSRRSWSGWPCTFRSRSCWRSSARRISISGAWCCAWR